MKLAFAILALLVSLAPAAAAADRTFAIFSLYYPVSTNRNPDVDASFRLGLIHSRAGSVTGLDLNGIVSQASGDVRGLQLNGVYGEVRGGMRGIQATGAVNYVGGEVRGGQGALIANYVAGGARGVQFGGLLNYNVQDFRGLQFTGGMNLTEGYSFGLQIAGLANVTNGDATGVQISSFLNGTSGELRGVQLGTANLARDAAGLQIGILNFARSNRGVQVAAVNVATEQTGVPVGLVNLSEQGKFQIVIFGMFAHPYHGSMYFGAARANNYDFWESVPFAFAGSFTWEYFFETHHPSFNDWIATSVGGVALGEVLYRLSSTILDNTATGSSRTWREIGGTVVSPMRGLTRLITGEAFAVGPNPPDRLPSAWGSELRFGFRRTSVENLWTSDTTRVFLRAGFDYGDPFAEGPRKPFDAFTFDGQLNFDEASTLGQIFGEGMLGSTPLRSTETAEHRLAGSLQFTYANTYAFTFGGQSVAADLLSRIGTPEGTRFETNLDASFYLLSAVNSHYENFSGREYDFGPGLGLGFRASLKRQEWDLLGFSLRQAWVHAANGNNVDHAVTLTTVRAQIPLRSFFGVGAEYALYLAESDYKDFADVSSRLPELRFYVVWANY